MTSTFTKSALAATAALMIGTSATAADPIDTWKDELRSKIQSSNRYPAKAVENQLEGVVKVRLTFAQDGNVQGVQFVEKSGHDVLDRRAFAAAIRLGTMPALPEGTDELSLVVPVRFELPDNS